MKKFNLMEWLDISDACEYLSTKIVENGENGENGKNITPKNIYQYAADSNIVLSLDETFARGHYADWHS